MDKRRLYLHEEMLLLSLHDVRGRNQGGWYQYALGGAILAELVLAERLAIEVVRKKRFVNVARTQQTGEAVLDDALRRVQTAKRRAVASTWVSRFAGLPGLWQRVADRLCLRGILRREEGRVLFVFSRKLYPTVNPAPERLLIERLERAIFYDGKVDARTALAVSLAHHTGILTHVFPRKELKRRKKHIENLPVLGDLSAAMQESIAAVQSATIAATMAVTVAATS